MNNITIELASEILKSKDAWEPVRTSGKVAGYKPKLKYIHEQIRIGREAIFYDQVYYPHLARLMEKVKHWNIFPSISKWVNSEFGYEAITFVWWPVDLHEEMADIIGDRMQYYLEPVWNGEEWGYYEPDEQELLSLGVIPDEIAVQPSLL